MRCANLPISIIIVGVGNEDFESMDILDADDEPLYSMKHKRFMDADIVQFVPFRDFRNNPTELAKATLDEVPRQLVDYMRRNHITPQPASDSQKRKIQQKLAASCNIDSDGENDEFFENRKEQLIQRCVDKGARREEVMQFIENMGICEESDEVVLENLGNHRYMNKLGLKYRGKNNVCKPKANNPYEFHVNAPSH